MSSSPPAIANAVYTSPLAPPSNTQTFTYNLPEAATDSQRLHSLKDAIETMQADVNTYLTERMEEEKKIEEAQGKKVVEIDEQNWGEEPAEE